MEIGIEGRSFNPRLFSIGDGQRIDETESGPLIPDIESPEDNRLLGKVKRSHLEN